MYSVISISFLLQAYIYSGSSNTVDVAGLVWSIIYCRQFVCSFLQSFVSFHCVIVL